MTDPISGLPASVVPGESPSTTPRQWGFVETLRGAMEDAEQLQNVADAKVSSLLAGNGTDVHTAMIAVEKADLSFQLMLQVRNKIVSAYQEISRMQF